MSPRDDQIAGNVDNTVVAVYINGTPQTLDGNAGNWNELTVISLDLSPTDVVAIHVQDAGNGVGGALVDITVDGMTYLSSSAWKVSTTPELAWPSEGFNDAAWPAATEIGPFGSTPPWDASVTGYTNTSAQWIWNADNEGDNDAYLRFTIPGV